MATSFFEQVLVQAFHALKSVSHREALMCGDYRLLPERVPEISVGDRFIHHFEEMIGTVWIKDETVVSVRD